LSSTSIEGSLVPPLEAELEVSIFGPGRGESVLVHLGAGDWIVVDSCIDQSDKRSPVLEYLQGLGVDASSQVRLVVGTHAHDDHVAGLSSVFRAAGSAYFVCSAAITSDEFFADVQADLEIESELRQSIRREYHLIFEEVRRRGRSEVGLRPLKRAFEQGELWSRPETQTVPRARILALSPSHEAVTRAIDALARGTARGGDRKRLSATDPNEFAIALWIEVGDEAVLLGADLLNGPTGCGWQAVLATFSNPFPASLYKVPHHGAPNAHSDGGHLPTLWFVGVSSRNGSFWSDMTVKSFSDPPCSAIAASSAWRSGEAPAATVNGDDAPNVSSTAPPASRSAGFVTRRHRRR
jgi:Metallo-beta-lactamase superfamily